MIWTILIAIVIFFLARFFFDLGKDNYDLQDQSLEIKFQHLVNILNEAAFDGRGTVTKLNKRSFNLYQNGSNQIINFFYSTGHLTITWKYKYFQKEVVHEKQFNDVRNLSLFDQKSIAESIINEMSDVVSKHQNDILGSI